MTLLVIGLVVGISSSVHAAPFDLTGHDWEGTAEFVARRPDR
jgi:hypothetical protein